MVTGQQQQPGLRWLRSALLLGGGGAVFTFLVVWLMQAFPGARILESGHAILPFMVALLVLGGLSWVGLYFALHMPALRAATIIAAWTLMFFILWLIGAAMGGLPFLMYLVTWALFGFAAAQLMQGSLLSPRKKNVTASRRTSSVVRTSAFGRVPADTVVLLTKITRDATGPITSALPNGTPKALRGYTIRAVITCVMRDWWENGNADGLGPRDIADLQSFVGLAATVAGATQSGAALQQPEALAVYRATLTVLLDDWLHNWNDGTDGPPNR